MTNILLLPLYEVVVETASNEDAYATFAFTADGDPPTPISLAGIDFRMQLRAHARDKAVALEGAIADGRLAIAANALTISIDKAMMAGIAPHDYAWDVVAIADGLERRVLTGTWRHRLGVTR